MSHVENHAKVFAVKQRHGVEFEGSCGGATGVGRGVEGGEIDRLQLKVGVGKLGIGESEFGI